jgi:hypothetical protein
LDYWYNYFIGGINPCGMYWSYYYNSEQE